MNIYRQRQREGIVKINVYCLMYSKRVYITQLYIYIYTYTYTTDLFSINSQRGNFNADHVTSKVIEMCNRKTVCNLKDLLPVCIQVMSYTFAF